MHLPENSLVGIVHPSIIVRRTLTREFNNQFLGTISCDYSELANNDFSNINLVMASELASSIAMRKLFIDTPYIILGSPRTEQDRQEKATASINTGAYDYMDIHENPRVLAARVRSALRRITREIPDEEKTITHSGVSLDILGRTIVKDGEQLLVAKQGFDLLGLLMKNPGIVFTRDQILNKVWGETYLGEYRVVDVQINDIRKAIGGDMIKTVRGVGYKFVGNEE